MKRGMFLRTLILVLMALLLSSCGALEGKTMPEIIDSMVDYQEWSYFPLPAIITDHLGLITTVLAVIVCVPLFWTVAHKGEYSMYLILLLAVAVLPFLVVSIEWLGEKFYPDQFTFTYIVKSRSWDTGKLDLDSATQIVVWASMWFPRVHASFEILVLFGLYQGVVRAIFMASWQPLVSKFLKFLNYLCVPGILLWVTDYATEAGTGDFLWFGICIFVMYVSYVAGPKTYERYTKIYFGIPLDEKDMTKKEKKEKKKAERESNPPNPLVSAAASALLWRAMGLKTPVPFTAPEEEEPGPVDMPRDSDVDGAHADSQGLPFDKNRTTMPRGEPEVHTLDGKQFVHREDGWHEKKPDGSLGPVVPTPREGNVVYPDTQRRYGRNDQPYVQYKGGQMFVWDDLRGWQAADQQDGIIGPRRPYNNPDDRALPFDPSESIDSGDHPHTISYGATRHPGFYHHQSPDPEKEAVEYLYEAEYYPPRGGERYRLLDDVPDVGRRGQIVIADDQEYQDRVVPGGVVIKGRRVVLQQAEWVAPTQGVNTSTFASTLDDIDGDEPAAPVASSPKDWE